MRGAQGAHNARAQVRPNSGNRGSGRRLEVGSMEKEPPNTALY